MKKTELGIFIVVLTAILIVACGEPPPRNVNTPPPAPTSAPIANLNANDMKKMRRTVDNRANTASNDETRPKDVNSADSNRAPVPKKNESHEGEEKTDEDENSKK